MPKREFSDIFSAVFGGDQQFAPRLTEIRSQML
jgi:hypothetical protein